MDRKECVLAACTIDGGNATSAGKSHAATWSSSPCLNWRDLHVLELSLESVHRTRSSVTTETTESAVGRNYA